MKNRAILTAILLSLPFVASANMIWPSLIIVQKYYAWYVILAALIIEVVAAHIFLKTDWLKSILVMVVVNVISALVGLILIPVSGLLIEVLMTPFALGTFSLLNWILEYLCAVLVNTCVEGLMLKWIFKYQFKPNFWWLFVANLISVIISFVLIFV